MNHDWPGNICAADESLYYVKEHGRKQLYDTGIYSKVTAGNVAVKHKKGALVWKMTKTSFYVVHVLGHMHGLEK